jgi:hypothetical protein
MDVRARSTHKEDENAYNFFTDELKGRDQLGDPGVAESIILKVSQKNRILSVCGLTATGSLYESPYDHGNEHPVAIS